MGKKQPRPGGKNTGTTKPSGGSGGSNGSNKTIRGGR